MNHVRAETLTTERVIPPGTNSPPEEISTHAIDSNYNVDNTFGGHIDTTSFWDNLMARVAQKWLQLKNIDTIYVNPIAYDCK